MHVRVLILVFCVSLCFGQKCSLDKKLAKIMPYINSFTMPVNGTCTYIRCNEFGMKDFNCMKYNDHCHNNFGTQSFCYGADKYGCVCGNSTELMKAKPKCHKSQECPQCDEGYRPSCSLGQCFCGQIPQKQCSLFWGGCPTGKVCDPRDLHCIKPPQCSFYGKDCDKQPCCSFSGHCHKRQWSSTPACLNTAFIGEDCTSGIPCDGTSQCIQGKCSLKVGSGCDHADAVCPEGTTCQHVSAKAGYMEGVNKMCVCNIKTSDNTCHSLQYNICNKIKEKCNCHRSIDTFCYSGENTSEQCSKACYMLQTINKTCPHQFYIDWAGKTQKMTPDLAEC
jgi:hypothetical protein